AAQPSLGEKPQGRKGRECIAFQSAPLVDISKAYANCWSPGLRWPHLRSRCHRALHSPPRRAGVDWITAPTSQVARTYLGSWIAIITLNVAPTTGIMSIGDNLGYGLMTIDFENTNAGTVAVLDSATLRIAGAVTGTGAILKTGSGTLTLSPPDTGTGTLATSVT